MVDKIKIKGVTILEPTDSEWEKLVAEWWNWFLSIPQSGTPAEDRDGSRIDQNQTHSYFFLSGSFGTGSFIRDAKSIRIRKPIFVPVVTTETSYPEYPNFKKESELRRASKEAIDEVRFAQVAINGAYLPVSKVFRIPSDEFNLQFPDKNVYYVKKGEYQAVSDGYWVGLLLPDDTETTLHIEAYAFSRGYRQNEATEFVIDVEYTHLHT